MTNITLVILGAGASRVASNSSAPHEGDWTPPLARELFDTGTRPHYRNLMRPYSGAVAISGLLDVASRPKQFNFEQELWRLRNSPDAETRQNYKHVPPYLRDVLQSVSTHFRQTQSVGTYVQLIQTLLVDHPQEVAFLVLNYDTLLEQAITTRDSSWTFTKINNWVPNTKGMNIYKIHGSVNWFLPFEGATGDWLRECRGLSDDPDMTKVSVINSDSQTNAIRTENGLCVYPVLTAPLVGKGKLDLACPSEHADSLIQTLGQVSKVLIAGTRGVDEDLQNLLASHLKQRIEVVHVVAEDQEAAQETLNNLERKVAQLKIRSVKRAPVLYTGDFRQYVRSQQFTDFARDPH